MDGNKLLINNEPREQRKRGESWSYRQVKMQRNEIKGEARKQRK
jgi:hypothetical protein